MQANERAWVLLDKLIEDHEALGCLVSSMPCGAVVVDAGVKARGGIAAGLRIAEICTAGLASVSLTCGLLDGQPWPQVEVYCDQPVFGCFASQAAHLAVELPGLRGLGSGPACLLAKVDDALVAKFAERPERAVLVLEAGSLPDDTACQALAEMVGIDPGSLGILAAPTSCLAGCIQVAARSIETALHKLHRLNFDLQRIQSAQGKCPLAAPTGSDWTSLGRTNDAMTFGSQVWLAFRDCSDQELARLAKRLPASASPAYGRPFLDLLNEAGGNFYKIDPGIFAPAEVTLTSLSSGSSFHSGQRDEPRLAAALLENAA